MGLQLYGMAFQLASQVNNAGLFRDLYFLMLVFTVTSFAELIYDFVLNRNATQLILVKCGKAIICLYYIFILVFQGNETYVAIEQAHGPIPMPDFTYDCGFVIRTLVIVFLTEILIALTDKDEKTLDMRKPNGSGRAVAAGPA